ncbi:MAG: MFS transporter [Spirochaetae bacterium HGW-Spirochaetae-10]|nr:MAG: MFS transporter [Spirochaetae bacterium HGW-Spirochaetae-10]
MVPGLSAVQDQHEVRFHTRLLDAFRGTGGRNVFLLGLVSFFTDVSSEMIYPLLPVFLAALAPAQTALFIGLMDGLAESTSALLKIIAGSLSDRMQNRRLPAIIGYAISTFSRPAMALAGGPLAVVTLRFADRIGKGIRTPGRDALIRESAPPEYRGLAFSFHRAMDHAGAVLGPILALLILMLLTVLSPHGNSANDQEAGSLNSALLFATDEGAVPVEHLRTVFLIALLPGLFALLALFFVQEPRHEKTLRHDRNGSLPRSFYGFAFAVFFFTLSNSSDLFLVYLAATRFQASSAALLLLWVGLHITKIIFSLPGGSLSDRFDRRAVIIAGWLVYAVVYAGFAFATEFRFYLLFLFLYGAYYGLTEGAEKAAVADYVSAARSGRAFGIYHAAVGFAALPASLLFGWIWTAFNAETAFLTGALIAVGATALLVFVPRPEVAHSH